jgi:tRNA-Thr(GGU) m(6)t(6)A37 methyltransferase TsaA
VEGICRQGVGTISDKAIVVEPIGQVRNDVGEGKVDSWKGIESEVLLEERFEPLLDGIDDFSHLVVVGWLHEIENYAPTVHPRGRKDLPEVGVFATRTPYRPNPIGITVVRLVSRKGNLLTVSGLDFFNGTPVLDIKPFTPKYQGITDLRIPEWMESFYREQQP